eukprot:1205420-Amphidinium_carterae.1
MEKEEAPSLLSKTFDLLALRSFRPFLDGAWFVGHCMSTHAVLSQVYSAEALNAKKVPGGSGDDGVWVAGTDATIEFDKPAWAPKPAIVATDLITRLTSKPAGAATFFLI